MSDKRAGKPKQAANATPAEKPVSRQLLDSASVTEALSQPRKHDDEDVPLAPDQPVRLRISGQICEGQQLEASGADKRDVRVTVIRGGVSINGYYYGPDALQAIGGLLENAQAYVDHANGQTGSATRSVRDVVGFYRDANYVPPDTLASEGRVEATLHILESAQWLWSMICEAAQLGNPGLIGLSIDIFGTWQPHAGPPMREGRALKEVTGVLALNSCDVVTRPSAGGAFQHILHDASNQTNPPIIPHEGAFPMHDEQATNSPLPTEPENAPGTSPQRVQEVLQDQPAGQEARALLAELRPERAQLALERRLLECALPDAVKTRVRERYQGRIFEMSELERDLSSQRQMLADLSDAGLIRGHGYEKVASGSQITEAEKVQAAFDRMFDLEIDSRFGPMRGFTSIREAYARVTGDAGVSGLGNATQLGLIRVDESAPLARISEADTTTATFSYLLGSSMNKRLLKDYQAWPAEWQKFCTITPIRDFKQQTRVRLGAFGSLPTVAEDTAEAMILSTRVVHLSTSHNTPH